MDNKKIGKLIATLRRNQGLTQQELGDKVGVGFRAVSKWERGINLPDISIINDLSKILGISSDELLSGELKTEKSVEEKKKISLTLKIILTSIISIIAIFTTIFLYYNNKTYTYNLVTSNDNDYYIEGQATFRGDEFTIIISNLEFNDKKLKSTIIKNYEYRVMSNDNFLFGYGFEPSGNYLDKVISIKTFAEEFRINYTGESDIGKNSIINNNIYLIINFIDQNDKIITKEIEIVFHKKEEKNS